MIENYEDAAFEFLDELRESGVTNMAGAGPYLQREFGFTRKDARKLLRKWMETFEARHPVGE